MLPPMKERGKREVNNRERICRRFGVSSFFTRYGEGRKAAKRMLETCSPGLMELLVRVRMAVLPKYGMVSSAS
jgi:hypothetical protein